MTSITTLFFDLGGVVLTNAWDHEQRRTIAAQFGFDFEDFESRHQQAVDPLERGTLPLHEYLLNTLFYEPRAFTEEAMLRAIEGLSKSKEPTIELLGRLRALPGLTLMTLNNEVRELNRYRIRRFGLKAFFSAFLSSCYLGLRKPEPAIYQCALDLAQREPAECAFVDDRPENVESAAALGMQAILFEDASQLEHELHAAGVRI